MKISKLWLWVSIFAVAFLAACSKSTIEQWAVATLSYEITDPMTQVIIASWVKEGVDFTYTWTSLFQLLEGAKAWEVRTDVFMDPFNEHDPDLTYKQTTLVLNEMGVPAEKGATVQLSDKTAIVTRVLSEDGIEQVELDANPIETIDPYIWTFTVESIK